jgi:hypothetical protein
MYAGFKRIEPRMAIMLDAVHPLFALLEYSYWISPELPPYRCGTPQSASSVIFCRCGSRASASSRMVAFLEVCFRVGAMYSTIRKLWWWSPPRWSQAECGKNEKFDTYLLVSGLGSVLKKSICSDLILCRERDIRTFLRVKYLLQW